MAFVIAVTVPSASWLSTVTMEPHHGFAHRRARAYDAKPGSLSSGPVNLCAAM